MTIARDRLDIPKWRRCPCQRAGEAPCTLSLATAKCTLSLATTAKPKVLSDTPIRTEKEGGGDGGESNSPSRTLRRRPLRACPMLCRRPPGRTSAPCRTVQSRVPRSGLTPDYATLVRIAASLHDASTTREAEVASTLTLPPKRRGRESTGGCQVLRFAACLTRPDGTSARTLRQPSPVETTHPHRTERRFGLTTNGSTRSPFGQGVFVRPRACPTATPRRRRYPEPLGRGVRATRSTDSGRAAAPGLSGIDRLYRAHDRD